MKQHKIELDNLLCMLCLCAFILPHLNLSFQHLDCLLFNACLADAVCGTYQHQKSIKMFSYLSFLLFHIKSKLQVEVLFLQLLN